MRLLNHSTQLNPRSFAATARSIMVADFGQSAGQRLFCLKELLMRIPPGRTILCELKFLRRHCESR